jgi:hypothetical protein
VKHVVPHFCILVFLLLVHWRSCNLALVLQRKQRHLLILRAQQEPSLSNRTRRTDRLAQEHERKATNKRLMQSPIPSCNLKQGRTLHGYPNES